MQKHPNGTRVAWQVDKETRLTGTVLLGGPMYTVAEDGRPGLYCWPIASTEAAK